MFARLWCLLRLVLLRAAAVDAWIVPFREEPDLFSAKLQAAPRSGSGTASIRKEVPRSLRCPILGAGRPCECAVPAGS